MQRGDRAANDLDQAGDIDRRRHLILVAGKPRRLTPKFWWLFNLPYRHRGDVVDNDRIQTELYDEMEQPLAAKRGPGKRAPAQKGAGRVEVRDRQPPHFWRAATLMLWWYCDTAEAESKRRGEELAADGDNAGVAVWRRIIRRSDTGRHDTSWADTLT
jgi:hypothetical protein